MIYLDAAATTPARREVIDAMWPYLTGTFGNPSSHHSVGEAAAEGLKDARARLARWLDCRASEIVFTSGGTEANNLAIKGIALASPRGRHVVTTKIEHEAVLQSCDFLRRQHGFEIDFVETGRTGLVTPEALLAVLRPDTTLVSIAHANNEVGTAQPIAELATIARAAGVPFHTDAVQSAGWLDTRVTTLGVDALSISGHKIGVPKGIGALLVRGRIPLEPLVHGGGQERGARSGTENVAGAVGLATAVELVGRAQLSDQANVASVTRDAFIASVLARIPDATLTGHPTLRLPAHASFVFPGTSGETVLLELESRGVVCSSGSACAAGSDEPSHVLTALGYSAELAQTAVRFSWGGDIQQQQLDQVADAVAESVETVRSIRTSS